MPIKIAPAQLLLYSTLVSLEMPLVPDSVSYFQFFMVKLKLTRTHFVHEGSLVGAGSTSTVTLCAHSGSWSCNGRSCEQESTGKSNELHLDEMRRLETGEAEEKRWI